MTIIKIEPDETGFHTTESQPHRRAVWQVGYIEVPAHLVADVNATGGYCDLTIEDGKLVGITPTERPEPIADPAVEIAELKAQLIATDYKAIKYAEGWLTMEEYAPVKAQRQALRDEINRLEAVNE